MATKKTPAPNAPKPAANKLAAAAKPTAKPAAGAKPAAVSKATQPAATNPAPSAEAKVVGEVVKLKELVEAVSAASGAKKKEARELVEATLAALGAVLTSGKELNLPGLGRLKVVKTLEKANNGRILTAKIRMGGDKNASDSKQPLAQPGEDE